MSLLTQPSSAFPAETRLYQIGFDNAQGNTARKNLLIDNMDIEAGISAQGSGDAG